MVVLARAPGDGVGWRAEGEPEAGLQATCSWRENFVLDGKERDDHA